MSLRVADRVDEWEERPVEVGYAGLHALTDEGFSGVVRAGGAELYMTAGTVVGVEHGSIADFEAATGTAYEAPVPALPLLCVMQAADADVRAQYYTEETPISEVDGTLSDGGFTGYVELSENVLSGDYFLVYHGGRSMAVGFVGAAGQLITDDEAFETADDEVGIFKVRQVDVEPIELPEPADADEPTGEPEVASEVAEPASEESDGDDADDSPDDAGDEPAAERPAEDPTAEPDAGTGEEGTPAGNPEPEASTPVAEPEPSEGRGDGSVGGNSLAAGSGETTGRDGPDRERDRPASNRRPASNAGSGGPAGSAGGGRSGGGAADLETRSIPSLDPERTHLPQQERSSPVEPEPTAEPEPTTEPEPRQSAQHAQTASAPEPADPDRVADLRDELAEKETEIDDLEQELAEAESGKEELEADLEAVREERDELADRVADLEAELRRLEEEMGAATDAERRMTPSEAIEGTNLFVDYDSKGAATLAKAHDGTEGREDVAENLQLGVHTEFADAGVAVNGRDFHEWLRSTLHYRFAEWVVSTLVFEIRDTGHANDLVDLYDAIPEIRRVEFNGAVDVEYVEDGQEKGGREHFDVIFRHRMGDPLVVANLNESRDPATGSMMETLVTSAERVGQTADSLSTAVLVTSSFFESAALETVSEATRGGILSRDKRTSFVNLSRKTGYHLCLVAAREDNFHMEVPEL